MSGASFTGKNQNTQLLLKDYSTMLRNEGIFLQFLSSHMHDPCSEVNCHTKRHLRDLRVGFLMLISCSKAVKKYLEDVLSYTKILMIIRNVYILLFLCK